MYHSPLLILQYLLHLTVKVHLWMEADGHTVSQIISLFSLYFSICLSFSICLPYSICSSSLQSAYQAYSALPWYQTPVHPFYPSSFSPFRHHPEPEYSVLCPFTLKFINNCISRCQGCKGLLRVPATTLPLPPHDLIVSRLECHPYLTPDKSVRIPKTPSNSHYHLRMECLIATDPEFDPHNLVLPEEVKEKLTSQH